MPNTKINKSNYPHEINLPKNASKLPKLRKLVKPVKAFFECFFPNKNSIKKNPKQIIRDATINPFYSGNKERHDPKRQRPVGQPMLPPSRSINLGLYNSGDPHILQEIQKR